MYERLAAHLKRELEGVAKDSGVKTHSVVTRVKERQSFLQKIQRKMYADPFGLTPDLVGARVVCLFVEDLPELDRIIRRKFIVVEREDKTKSAASNSFDYMSVHYVCFLRPKPQHDDLEDLIDIQFEIQCRTILMDAWANVSHYLAYKGSASVPEEVRRDLNALSALFHIADKQFQQIYGSVTASEAAAIKSGISHLDELSLNRTTLKALLREMFPMREPSSDADYSEFVEQLNACECTGLADLKRLVYTGLAQAEDSERESPPGDPVTLRQTRYTDVGIARTALSQVDKRFREWIEKNLTIDDYRAYVDTTYGGY